MNVSANTTRIVGYIGAAANWLIPIAGFGNLINQDPAHINPLMTTTLMVYSSIFWRWAIAITPANWLLLACHTANASVQGLTLGKWAFAPRAITANTTIAK
jgi:hypothetical protein